MLENNETLVKGAKKTRHKGGVFFFGLEDEMEIPTHRTSTIGSLICKMGIVIVLCIIVVGIQ